MPVEFRVLEGASAGIIKNSEVAFVDVLAQSRPSPFHLLVEDRALERAYKDDVFHIRGNKARRQQIHRTSDPRFALADDREIAFELVAIAFRACDAGSVIWVT